MFLWTQRYSKMFHLLNSIKFIFIYTPSATIKIVSEHFMEILQEETLNRTRVEEEIYTLYVCMC